MNERLKGQETTRVVKIDKPEGTYTIIYGAHNRETNSDLFPKSFDGFVVEWPSDNGQKLPDYFSGLGRLLMQQFQSVLEYAEANRVPIYNTDISVKGIVFWPTLLLLPFNPPTSRLREAIMAHKEEWMMKNVKGVNHLVTIIGSSHVGIEQQIKKPYEDRLNSLRHLRLVIKGVAGKKNSIYSIPRFDFNGKEWQLREVLEVPDLKALAR